ncbi:hypothetical protein Tco_1264618 [Tanacetum coccineum]
MLLKYLEHQTRLLEEVEVVAMKVETQEEFLVHHVSFISFYELPPDELDVDLNNLTPMTSAEPHTSHCERHEPGRSYLQTSFVEEFPSYQQSVVVVVIVEIIAIDVGSEESDYELVRSITRVVIQGTEEVS